MTDRKVVKKPGWLSRVPTGVPVDFELVDVLEVRSDGAWLLIGDPNFKNHRGKNVGRKRTVTKVWVPNPWRPSG